jgi:predicted phage-related endonuclease
MSTSLPDRRSFIGGSDARVILGNDEAALHRLWQEKRGEVEPEDLSGNLIVQLGVVTEPLNRHWFERNTGHAIKDIQRLVKHPVVNRLLALLEIGHYIVPVLVQCRLEQVIFGEPVQIAAKVLVISEITSRARESSAR